MARGTQLGILIAMLRAEAGHSTLVSAGIDNLPALKQKLTRCQTMLYDDYDWPFMTQDFDIPLQAGLRYYDIPDGIDLERIDDTAINYSGRPTHLPRGIGFEQYAEFNSDNGDRASPARRWDVKRVEDSKEQIEMWPVPADNDQVFWIRGKRKLRALVAETDLADLDDLLIVLTAASEILSRQKSADAPKVEAAAAARLRQLKSRTKGVSRMITMSGSSRENRNLGKTIIRIGSQTN